MDDRSNEESQGKETGGIQHYSSNERSYRAPWEVYY